MKLFLKGNTSVPVFAVRNEGQLEIHIGEPKELFDKPGVEIVRLGVNDDGTCYVPGIENLRRLEGRNDEADE